MQRLTTFFFFFSVLLYFSLFNDPCPLMHEVSWPAYDFPTHWCRTRLCWVRGRRYVFCALCCCARTGIIHRSWELWTHTDSNFYRSGQLTEAVRRKPYAVILLDELEKAHKVSFHLQTIIQLGYKCWHGLVVVLGCCYDPPTNPWRRKSYRQPGP